jgi:PAS domain S-box-containing protein
MSTSNSAASAEQNEAVLASIGEGLLVVNEYGNITNINPAALKLLGGTAKTFLGAWLPRSIKLYDNNGDAVPTFNQPIVMALETGRPAAIRTNILNRKGVKVPVYFTAAPFLSKGKLVGAVCIFRDLSHEVRIERAKDEFVSLASHQLRTPATAVKNFIGLLRDGYAGPLTPEQQQYIDYAYESNESQLALISDLLNVARSESGRLELNITQVSMTELIASVVHEQQGSIDERQQTIELQMPKAAVFLPGDRDQLRMVVDNLVSNASKYTPTGGHITVSLRPSTKAIIVEVTDTGVGIAQKDQPKLFKKFARIQNARSTVVGGTGLGLYIVKQLVELHDGTVTIKSSLGQGSTFTVRLPISRS